MVGNKHKNGIICTFPSCNKPMRTQKFKMHFTRAHLKDGEVYSVEHRRQYEVAREENARSTVKSELVPAVATAAEAPPVMSTTTTMGGISRVETMYPAAAALENIDATQARQVQNLQAPLSSNLEYPVTSATRSENGAANTSASPRTIHITSMVPTSAQTLLSSDQISGIKRPIAAVESSSGDAVDPTSVLLMQFIALMDQRFQELVSKMGEMIDVQKDLIDTLQASNPGGQAPASAFSHAVEVVMKRRKKDTSPRSGSNSENGNGNANADANGGSQGDGFVL
ncbi:hypothetical protein PI124_g12866 [Phytophthora idaei]|nr:hypothetical protein PI125_g12380 [Phytophthora idaei]KAG3150608.1 hypothetical protein PI126_g11405 [Phytophthora idaei]KAG3242273.1 hypothetical protein PI124_g12866 [Phytophthora idaei]